MKKLGIYIHIPFCKRKCLYCDFVSFAGCDDTTKEDYVRALCEEICLRGLNFDVNNYEVDTVFIGGGTPSMIDAKYIAVILETVGNVFNLIDNPEISIEVNPGTVEYDMLKIYKEAGVNRLSIGLQSAQDDELCKLGRIHQYYEFRDTYRSARKAGFDNINIDLMSAIPGQTLSSYENTLDKILDLKPEHISSYSLIIEEGTPFYKMELDLPDEDTEREMYYLTKNKLASKGYERYEISNYSIKGKECLHNIGYWTGKEYLGVGLNAASYYGGKRYKNTCNLEEYIIGEFDDECIECDEKSEMEEFMFLRLRMMNGLSAIEFERKFGKNVDEVYGEVLKKHIKDGLIVREEDNIKLSDKGIDVSNYVLADFLLED